MQYFLGRLFLFSSISFCALTAHATDGINMSYGVSPISHQTYNLHMAVLYLCCVIGLLTVGVLFYSLIQFRRSQGTTAKHFHKKFSVEILWNVISVLILIALALPALGFKLQDKSIRIQNMQDKKECVADSIPRVNSSI